MPVLVLVLVLVLRAVRLLFVLEPPQLEPLEKPPKLPMRDRETQSN